MSADESTSGVQELIDRLSHESVAEGKKQAEAQDDNGTRRYYEGQLHELLHLRDYISQRIDLKTQKYY